MESHLALPMLKGMAALREVVAQCGFDLLKFVNGTIDDFAMQSKGLRGWCTPK
jgi:hypothetical protein